MTAYALLHPQPNQARPRHNGRSRLANSRYLHHHSVISQRIDGLLKGRKNSRLLAASLASATSCCNFPEYSQEMVPTEDVRLSETRAAKNALRYTLNGMNTAEFTFITPPP